jgi:ABC-type transport system involved in multi-copper enzyme maturation permease subunit
MVLGFGPVVRYELITTARRARYYLARVAYGLSLLFVLSREFALFDAYHPGGGTAEQVRQFAESAFISFAGAQTAALLCLIPALCAGVMADDYQRKTLHYLLASRLSSLEIVLGKLGARLVHVGTFVALGIPVVCLLALYGGLNPVNVFYVYFGTLTLVLFLAGLSIFVSILARRPRDAILVAYGIEGIWLFGPPTIREITRYIGGPLWWVDPVNSALLVTNPVFVWGEATRQSFVWTATGPTIRPFWFAGQFAWIFGWMAGAQAGAGLLFIALAVLGLRPLRGSSWPGAKPRTGWWARLAAGGRAAVETPMAAPLAKNRILVTPRDRKPCGDDPMLWKERHTRMGGGLSWLNSRPMILFWSVLLGCYLLDVSYPILSDALDGRWSRAGGPAVTDALRGSSTALAVLAILGVAAASAVSVTSEREQDTWLSLATTLLVPAEVIRAKQLGAIWSARWIGLALLVIWAAGMLLGALHPLGVLAAAVFLALTAWVIASVGVCASALARNSTRAILATFITLLVFSWTVPWPFFVWQFLVPLKESVGDSWISNAAQGAISQIYSLIVSVLGVIVAYGVSGALLTAASISSLKARWSQ